MVKKVYLVLILVAGCNSGAEAKKPLSLDKDLNRDALFSAAIDNGFSLDGQIKNRLENQHRRVLGRLYLENIINRRVSVSMDEVKEYYNKTKDQHVRQQREFLVLRFVVSSVDSARDIRKKLLAAKKSGGEEKLGPLMAEFLPSREIIGENKINKSIKNKLLGGPGSVVGPISSGGQHVVLRLISTYEKGTTKEQIHIEETLRNQLFAMKAHALRQNLVDSLKSKYAVSK